MVEQQKINIADLIQRRINNFWGYGSLEALVWFVGMEEGLNPTIDTEELEERLKVADGKTTIDMRRNMAHLTGHIKWFQPNAPIQSTWKYPIALYLYLKNHRIPTQEEIRYHQANILGDSILKETSTVELMPLPSRKANESTWLYGKYNIEGLGARKEYLSLYKPRRVQELKHLIEEYSPKLVIFYSVLYLPEWSEIIGMKPELISPQMYFAQSKQTSFCILPQGSSFGMSYKRLYEYVKKIENEILIK